MHPRFGILTLAVLILAFMSPVFAQENISANDAANFLDKKATVCDTVARAHYAPQSKGQPTFLDLGESYPRQLFTVPIWGSGRGKFESPPETLAGKEICVTGVIKAIHGRAERYPLLHTHTPTSVSPRSL